MSVNLLLNIVLKIGMALFLLLSLITQNNMMVVILVLFAIAIGALDVYEKPSIFRALFYIALIIIFLVIWFVIL
ncbi:hypothetical protein [Lentibacillus sediminis]|uniref:hypothetical protein n=1 Tax=Lentibacillus sediminis TaxID=1940529 RepID=UPI000C1C73D4|nr:hypothetical protein [Lentibacillus sediminis]